MALAAAPSGIYESQETIQLSTDAQSRVDAVAKNAIMVLDTNSDDQSVVRDLFGEMIAKNLRDPENIAKIQNGLYEARDTRLAQATPNEKLPILESFSTFMAQFTQWIAQMNRDISLSNQAKTLKNGSDIKIAQVQATYAQILANNHPNQTA